VGVAQLSVPHSGSYYTRVSAYNGVTSAGKLGVCSHGISECWGEARSSQPSVLSTSDQQPGAVVMPQVRTVSSSELFVQWDMPQETGGKPVTHFKVEWDYANTFDSGVDGTALGEVELGADAAAPQHVADTATGTVYEPRDTMTPGTHTHTIVV
jgi:hypothetical protein